MTNKINKKVVLDMPTDMGEFYAQMINNVMSSQSNLDEMMFGKITGYRNVKVPKYLKIKIPVITKEYDDEYGDGSFRGYLISLKEITLFRIGTVIEKQAVRKKTTRDIKWSRNNDFYTA